LLPWAQPRLCDRATPFRQISKDFFQVHQGSLYPALHRQEGRGWLQAEWKESETVREAKFYALTKKGRQQLDAEVLNWGKLSEAVAGSSHRGVGG
jgi:PadR family transcriptional regulator PadR